MGVFATKNGICWLAQESTTNDNVQGDAENRFKKAKPLTTVGRRSENKQERTIRPFSVSVYLIRRLQIAFDNKNIGIREFVLYNFPRPMYLFLGRERKLDGNRLYP